MANYPAAMAAGTLLCFALYAARLRREGGRLTGALITLPVAAVLGLVCAKLGFVLLQPLNELEYYGISAFWRVSEDAFSFVFGAMGVCLGVGLCARWTGLSLGDALDAFAPAGALLTAVFRLGEGFLGSLGLGGRADPDSPLAVFPFAVVFDAGNGRLRTQWAVYLWATAIAAIVALIFLVSKKSLPGLMFQKTAFALALPQIMLESLRTKCIKWGFVRAEQVVCALIILALVVWVCVRTPVRLPVPRRFWPVAGLFGCAGIIIAVEFVIGKPTLVPFEVPLLANYGLMALALAGMALLYWYCLRRQREAILPWQMEKDGVRAD
ncbi:MAG: prolipoprotein diacylglyceryl transferase [Clostridia bacterium]|nr:prolipoprotein diacylglyceryl transferase [Clostridia bacterium]